MTTPTLNDEKTLQRGRPIKNRLIKSAMSEQLGNARHDPDERLARLYRAWADGGIGLSMTGNVMIDRNALGEPKNVVLDEQSDLEAFRHWAEQGKANATQVWMQLNHPGKQIPKFLNSQPVAPSAVPLGGGLEKMFATPRALEADEIQAIIGQFARSAHLAKETGFSGVQIHGAHGYLVSQFLSPRHNQRDDEWGGSPENRRRFVLAVHDAIREAVGLDFPVGIKLNSADFMKDGFSEEESMDVVRALSEAGIDLIEISGGTYEAPAMTGFKAKKENAREAYFLDYADAVRRHTDVPLMVTGGFRSATAMQQALDSGATDFIGLARPVAVDPELPRTLLSNPQAKLAIKRPSTGFKGLDKALMLDITYYESQLARHADGKKPKPGLSPWITVANTFAAMGMNAFKPRRG
ncbi:NADH:flavin oxidoreductase/NADH oxidase family protein [Vreelandella utahensis]|uniref:NADH:flavin oxidoreductase/NADH oxidase family protein n=1 Tax=Vreelandella halophila TaxID=86177 RepID=UPI000985C58A|nr:NADH:flavin oxidoreductase/NADH oxidase family protein [Halomonas utahensis]